MVYPSPDVDDYILMSCVHCRFNLRDLLKVENRGGKGKRRKPVDGLKYERFTFLSTFISSPSYSETLCMGT